MENAGLANKLLQTSVRVHEKDEMLEDMSEFLRLLGYNPANVQREYEAL